MSPDLMFWFALTTKMAITALFVSVATIIAERLGATVGALVATLPVSAGPVYVFLALDNGPAFISVSAVASLALNAATAIYVTVYVLIAQRRSIWISISLAFAVARCCCTQGRHRRPRSTKGLRASSAAPVNSVPAGRVSR